MFSKLRISKKISITLCFLLLVSLLWVPSSFASDGPEIFLNGSGNKANNFQGYRYLNDHQIKIWVDKNSSPDSSGKQFKIFEGTTTDGKELTITKAESGPREGNVSDVSGLSGGATMIITTEEAFEPGKTYTVVINNTIMANNQLTVGHFRFRKDITFSLTVPDVNDDTNNSKGNYSSVPLTLYTWPENNGQDIPHEGNIWFALNVPAANAEDIVNGLVLEKDGQPVVFDETIDMSEDGEIYKPLVSDDHTFFFFPMTGGGGNTSYNLDRDCEYTLIIPEIKAVNGETLPERKVTFHTAPEILPTKIIGAPIIELIENDFKITWTESAEISDISPGATGYNVYVSPDQYWDFRKLNEKLVIDTIYTTSSECRLMPNTDYYFRVTPLNGIYEAGFSSVAQGKTPEDTVAPAWPEGSLLNISNNTSTGLVLSWPEASDNTFITKYKIYKDGELLEEVDDCTLTYAVKDLSENTAYTFEIEAVDAGGNTSSTNLSETVKTLIPSPALKADTTDNMEGQSIDIAFEGNNLWESAITDIIVDGIALTEDQYVITNGNIHIIAAVFTDGADYDILVKADGYEDAKVCQTINSMPSTYIVNPCEDDTYSSGITEDEIKMMTVNKGFDGFKYFTVSIKPIKEHDGEEVVLFVHLKDGIQGEISATKADFDTVNIAKAGFNVNEGDVIKVYIVDDLTNDIDFNPTVLQ